MIRNEKVNLAKGSQEATPSTEIRLLNATNGKLLEIIHKLMNLNILMGSAQFYSGRIRKDLGSFFVSLKILKL